MASSAGYAIAERGGEARASFWGFADAKQGTRSSVSFTLPGRGSDRFIDRASSFVLGLHILL